MEITAKHEKLLVIDFGSQYTQLVARRVREIGVYCEVLPCGQPLSLTPDVKGIILSGSPCSVHQSDAPMFDFAALPAQLPLLGICYGAQMLAHTNGGTVARSEHREYGRAMMHPEGTSPLLEGCTAEEQVWMSHGDSITELPASAVLLASTETVPVAAFSLSPYRLGVQFHPEVSHSLCGRQILANFLLRICGCRGDWTPAAFVEESVQELRNTLGSDKVVLGLSGGVDSSVAALLLHRAIGEQLTCIFINHGLLRRYEYEEVLASYRELGLNVIGVDESARFFAALAGVTEPEAKRKAIGRCFIEAFDEQANRLQGVKWLAQGTIYPDVIESSGVPGKSVTIKSHHNVGGLPDRMQLKLVEPLRLLFKDEVRRVGATLSLPAHILHRHPFPGPGLAIRVLGEVTPERVDILQQADRIFTDLLREEGLYDKIWQAGAMLLPVRSVGVMGDERSYEAVVALRAVNSVDGMTADWYPMPHEALARISSAIINGVKGVNRVVYDVSSKPPATIEWE